MSGPRNLSEFLKEEMERRQWTQADLARNLPAATGAVSNWINGTRMPKPETVRRMAAALTVDADFLLTLAGHRDPDPYYDPESPEAQLVPLIRAIDWAKAPGQLSLFKNQLAFIAKIQRDEKVGETPT